MKLQLGWILVFIPRPFCPARITVKPTGGEGERQAGATPIFPKKTEEPNFSVSVNYALQTGFTTEGHSVFAELRWEF